MTRRIWLVADSWDGDVACAATSEEKARQLAVAHNGEVCEAVQLYEDDDPVPEYITLYTYDLNDRREGNPGLLTSYNVLATDYTPHEDRHRSGASGSRGHGRAWNYLSQTEAVDAATRVYFRNKNR